MGCAATLNLVRRPDAQGTETEVEGDQIRPRGCQAYWASSASDEGCAAVRSRGLGPILSRICLEPVSTRDKSPNSASKSPLRGHTPGVTKVSQETALQPLVDGPVRPASGIIPDAAQAQSFTAYRPATASPSRPSSAACPTCSASAASRLPPAASTCPASSSPSTASPTTRSSASPTTPRTRLDRGPHGGV